MHHSSVPRVLSGVAWAVFALACLGAVSSLSVDQWPQGVAVVAGALVTALACHSFARLVWAVEDIRVALMRERTVDDQVYDREPHTAIGMLEQIAGGGTGRKG